MTPRKRIQSAKLKYKPGSAEFEALLREQFAYIMARLLYDAQTQPDFAIPKVMTTELHVKRWDATLIMNLYYEHEHP